MPETTIGMLRERLAIEAATETADAEGQPVKVWNGVTTVWARAEFLSGRELEAMSKINADISVRFTVRYRADLTEKMHIVWRGSMWNIHAIQPAEDKFYLALLAGKVE